MDRPLGRHPLAKNVSFGIPYGSKMPKRGGPDQYWSYGFDGDQVIVLKIISLAPCSDPDPWWFVEEILPATLGIRQCRDISLGRRLSEMEIVAMASQPPVAR